MQKRCHCPQFNGSILIVILILIIFIRMIVRNPSYCILHKQHQSNKHNQTYNSTLSKNVNNKKGKPTSHLHCLRNLRRCTRPEAEARRRRLRRHGGGRRRLGGGAVRHHGRSFSEARGSGAVLRGGGAVQRCLLRVLSKGWEVLGMWENFCSSHFSVCFIHFSSIFPFSSGVSKIETWYKRGHSKQTCLLAT